MNVATAIPAVSLDRVSRLFGSFAALRELSLELPAGTSAVLLGENGAGKSTLLRMVAGLLAPTFGKVRVFGEDALDVRERIGYMSHSTQLYDELTARENLEYVRALYAGVPHLQTAEDSLLAVGLDPANPRRLGEYSQGMRQRTALARALLTSPDLLLLDEPFSNLDAESASRMITRLQTFLADPGSQGQPRTLLLTTHQRELARPLASTTITLRDGRLASIEQTTQVSAR